MYVRLLLTRVRDYCVSLSKYETTSRCITLDVRFIMFLLWECTKYSWNFHSFLIVLLFLSSLYGIVLNFDKILPFYYNI